MKNLNHTHSIEDINLMDGLLTILVHESDINKSADVTIYFEWDWSNTETEKIPSLINVNDITFHEESGDKESVKNYIIKLVDEYWLHSVLNGMGEPIVSEYIYNL